MEPPSLQRLLALNKPGRGFEEKLEEGASILNLPEDWSQYDTPDAQHIAPTYALQKRAEWLLKWLLQSFKSEDASVSNPRSTRRAWVFLVWLTSLCPVEVVAKHLSEAKFLHLLHRTLSELAQSPGSTTVSQQDGSASDAQLKPSKKRKRGAESSPVSASSVTEVNGQLLAAIALALKQLVDLTKPSSSSRTSATEQLMVALTVDVVEAADLLRLWENRILVIFTEPPDYALSAMLPIWEASVSRGAADTQDVPAIFCKACLIPTLKLLDRAVSGSLHLLAVQQQADRLLRHHLVWPVRTFALSLSSKQRRRNGEIPAQVNGFAAELLLPLQQEVNSSVAKDTYLSGDQASRLISSVLEVALRNCPRQTPKHKAREESWLSQLFLVLCQCAGLPISGESTASDQPVSTATLCAFLDACLKHKFSPGLSLLESIATRYSGISSLEQESIAWPLVAKLLELDANVFLPRGTRDEPLDSLTAGSLHENIIKALTSVPWDVEYDTYSTAHKLATRDADGLSNPARVFMAQYGLAPDQFVSRLPMTLLRAYAHGRDLNGFLAIWRSELVKSTRHIVVGTGTGSIWEDQSLAVSLREVLESSLNKEQITSVLSNTAGPFEDLEDAQNIMYVFTELRQDAQGTGAAASLALLDALVPAIRSDTVLAYCTDILPPLLGSLLSVGSRVAINKLHIMNRIWRTISSILTLLIPYLSAVLRYGLFNEVAPSACTQAAVDAIREGCKPNPSLAVYERALFALDYVLAVYSCDHTGDAAITALEVCVDFIMLQDRKSKHELTAKLLRFTYVFEAISAKQRSGIYDHLITAAAESDDDPEHVMQIGPRRHSASWNLCAFVELAGTTLLPDARNDLLHALVRCLQYSGPKPRRLILGKLARSMLARLPASIIPRSLREDCLNEEFRHIRASSKMNHGEPIESHLAFMVKLLEVPNATASLYKDAKSLLQLCDDSTFIEQRQCEPLCEELVRRVLSYVTPDHAFIKDLAEVVLETVNASTLLPPSGCLLVMRYLVSKADALTQRRILSIEMEKLEVAAEHASADLDDQSRLKFFILLDSVRLHLPLMRSFWPTARDDLGRIIATFEQAKQPNDTMPSRTSGALLLYTANDSALGECLAVQTALSKKRPILEQRRLLHDLHSVLIDRPLDQRLSVLAKLDLLIPDAIISTSSLKVIHVLLASLEGSSRTVNGPKLPLDLLGRLAYELSNSGDAELLGYAFECIKTVVSTQHWLVSQYSIDALLASSTILSSASAPVLPAEFGRGLYLQLCSCTTSVVALQRVKLQGRFHLLMPLLINLLNCLFVPHLRTSEEGPLRLPGWIAAETEPLSVKHATAFSRLLSTLATPTMSAVSSHKRRRTEAGTAIPLKDETKLARTYVGEYVPLLVAAYCSAQLHGKMAPEVRHALLPGLWSCMETVEMNAWRAMSERMRENERAIWQSLWADWKRSGGGGQARDERSA